MIACSEQERLETLRVYGVLDTPPEAAFDRLTALAAGMLDMPMAAVSFVDEHRQWFKSACGLAISETPRAQAFCAHTICGDAPMMVEDAALDPRFSRNLLVLGEPYVRFYAGAPIVVSEGRRIGALCVMDRRPRRLSVEELERLQMLAACVASELDRRLLSHVQADARGARDALVVERRRLASVFMHELRTPLNAILGYCAMLQHKPVAAEHDAYIEAVRKAASDIDAFLKECFGDADVHPAPAPQASTAMAASGAGELPSANLERQPAGGGRPLEILVVDDVPANRTIMQAFLTRLGYSPVLARDGEEAAELASRRRFDIIFMDIQMPVLDGLSAARRILRDGSTRQPWLVAITCDTSRSNWEACAEAGFSDFMAKPTSIAALANSIENYRHSADAETAAW